MRQIPSTLATGFLGPLLPLLLALVLITLFPASIASMAYVPTPAPSVSPSLSIVQKPTLILVQGEQRLLRIPGLAKYSMGAPILRVLRLPAHSDKELLLLKGSRSGVTDLWVWKNDGSTEIRNIRVVPTQTFKASRKKTSLPPTASPSELELALEMLQETEVIFTGAAVVMRGEIRSQAEAFRVAGILLKFQKEVRDETWPSQALLTEFQALLEGWLKKSLRSPSLKDSGLHLEAGGQTLWLKGNVPSVQVQKQLEKESRALCPFLQMDLENLPDSARTVHFKVFLMELRQGHFSSSGLSWPTQLEASLSSFGSASDSGSGSGPPISGGQLKWVLNQLEAKGQGKILSQPELVVRAPGEAELFSGGEIPIQIQSRFYSNINWRNYGLTLRLKITHATDTKIRLEIFIEVSHLDRQVSKDGIPGLQVNRMKNEVDAVFGRPLFLSGLFQRSIKEELKGFPFLQNIPVLGALFRSKDFVEECSELLAILYPSASPPPTSMKLQSLILPKGPLPFPRDRLDPTEENRLQQSEEFPWNVFP